MDDFGAPPPGAGAFPWEDEPWRRPPETRELLLYPAASLPPPEVRDVWPSDEPCDSVLLGAVDLLDVHGSDLAFVQAARASTGNGSKGAAADRRLIRYLLANRHDSPFEMADVKLRIECPIFVARQWMRHRSGSFNEFSGRYAEMPDSWFVPRLRAQGSGPNLQSSEERHVLGWRDLSAACDGAAADAFALYRRLLAAGVAREVARSILPLCAGTTFVWKTNFRQALHFLDLRAHPHAQVEIRLFAERLGLILSVLFPETMRIRAMLRAGRDN